MTRAPLTTVTGPAAPYLAPNVDTDVIIRVERMTSVDPAVLAPWAFEAVRYHDDGSERSDFVLNQDRYRAAPILLAGPNFGCGSSREPAALAIKGLGIRCIIAPSIGDIFLGNCTTNGILAITLDERSVEALAAQDGDVTVDLPAQRVTGGDRSWDFAISSLQKTLLVEGLDELQLCLRHAEDVARWEEADRRLRPWAWHLAGSDVQGGR